MWYSLPAVVMQYDANRRGRLPLLEQVRAGTLCCANQGSVDRASVVLTAGCAGAGRSWRGCRRSRARQVGGVGSPILLDLPSLRCVNQASHCSDNACCESTFCASKLSHARSYSKGAGSNVEAERGRLGVDSNYTPLLLCWRCCRVVGFVWEAGPGRRRCCTVFVPTSSDCAVHEPGRVLSSHPCVAVATVKARPLAVDGQRRRQCAAVSAPTGCWCVSV